MNRLIFSILLLSSALILPVGAWASDCAPYVSKIHWQSSEVFEPGEEMYSHELVWPYVISTGQNSKLVVTDFSDPDQPAIATSIDLPIQGTSLKHRNETLFVGGSDGLLMTMDISNPLQPVFRDSIHTAQQHSQIFLAGDHVWLNPFFDSISIVDVSQPDNLTVLGTLPYDRFIYDMIDCGALAYIGTEEDWEIYDFSDPTSPELLTQLSEPAYSFALTGQTLLVGRRNEIATYDVSDPTAPLLIGSVETEGEVRNLVIHNGVVSALQPSSGDADLFWLQEDGSLEWITDYSGWFLLAEVFFTDEHLYFCCDQNINLINLSDLKTISGSIPVETPGPAPEMEMIGSLGFSPMGYYGMAVYDFENPKEPVLVGSGATPYNVQSISLRDNAAYLAGSGGVSILDVTDPTIPSLIGSIEYGNYYDTVDIVLHQNTAWLGFQLRSVTSIDISDPTHPEPGITLPFRARALKVDQGLLHTINSDGIYRVLSLETSPPVELANLQLTTGGRSIVVKDNLVLVGHDWFGLSFLDISDPENPLLINHMEIMGGARKISIQDDRAVISNYRLTHILDISDPRNVEKLGTIWDGGINNTILPGGEIIVHHYRGFNYSFQAYPTACGILAPVPDAVQKSESFLSIHPNPFNPQTTISFDLPSPSPVTVRIFDLNGRLVQTLSSSETMSAGMQSWTWMGHDTQGKNASSGVYLVRLEAGQFEANGRMVLIR